MCLFDATVFFGTILFLAELSVTVSPNPASNIPVGSDVELTCDIFISLELPEDEITIQWEKFGAGALCSPPDCMRTITLTGIEVGNEGLYICRVTAGDQEGMGTTFLTTVGESKQKGMDHFLP